MTIEDIKRKLIDSNSNLSNTLNEEFLVKFYNLLPYDVLEYIVNYDRVQKILLTLTDTQIDIFLKILNRSLKNNDDWIAVLSDYVGIISWPDYNRYFKELLSSIEGKILDDNAITNLLFIIQNKRNFYKVNTYEELINFEDRKAMYEIGYNEHDPQLILLKKYGISYETAYSYLNRYGQSLNSLPDSKEKEILADFKNIIEGKGTDTLVFRDFDFISNLDSNFRKLFAKIYNERLFKVDDSSYIDSIEYNGISVPIYDAGTDFFLSIYSYGLASEYGEPDNFYEDWNRPNSKVPNFCNSIINRKSMRTTVKHCVYGFDTFGDSDIKLLGANDLGTNSDELNNTPNITDRYKSSSDILISPVEFRTPDDLINNTRYTNNEVYRSRRITKDGELQKVNPNYIIYLKNTSDHDMINDHIWKESLKAACQFGDEGPIPIVIVDCEKCFLTDLEELENMVVSFESTFDNKEILSHIVEYIQTLSFGFCNNKELMAKYNTKEIFMQIINRVFNHITEISSMLPNTAIDMLDLLSQTLDIEYAKQNKSKYWIEKSTGKSEVDRNELIDLYINKLKEQINIGIEKDLSGDTLFMGNSEYKINV